MQVKPLRGLTSNLEEIDLLLTLFISFRELFVVTNSPPICIGAKWDFDLHFSMMLIEFKIY